MTCVSTDEGYNYSEFDTLYFRPGKSTMTSREDCKKR